MISPSKKNQKTSDSQCVEQEQLTENQKESPNDEQPEKQSPNDEQQITESQTQSPHVEKPIAENESRHDDLDLKIGIDLDLGCDEVDLFSSIEDEEPIPQGPITQGLDLLSHEDLESVDNHEEDAEPVYYRLIEDEAAVISSLYLKQEMIKSTEGVNSHTRSIIIDSMLESLNAEIYPRAVHLAVRIYDRYVSLTVSPEQLNHESIASVALYIAAKFEYGITEAQRKTFVHRDADKELLILKTIDYRLHQPTTNLFVEALLVEETDSTMRFLCSYITELSLLDHKCSVLLPSSLAVACVFLGKYIMDPYTRPEVESPFPNTDDLRQPVLILHDLYTSRRFPFLRSTRDKYQYSSSQFECLETIPEEYFD